MHYLITGGAGFIGSHLTAALLDAGHAVTVIDDLSTGSMDNLAHVRTHPRFDHVIASILDTGLLQDLVDRCDVIFHLAASVGVELIVRHPTSTIETNIVGTTNVLRAAGVRGQKVIVTSTSEVYGKSTAFPFHENADLVLGATSKSRWSYAASKMIDEFLALAYFQERDVPVVITRLFNTVGPRQTGRYGMVIPRFVRQALLQQPVTVYGEGTQTRCFAHVTDAVAALVALADTEAAEGRIVNIGTTHEVSINDLARTVIDLAESKSTITHIPYEQAYAPGFEDMDRRVPDVTALRALTGAVPETPLSTILQDVIAWMREDMTLA